MQRRFAVVLLLLLVFLLLALLVGRRVATRAPRAGRLGAVPTARPTSVIPPTPIPAHRIAVYFESPADERLHAEARDVPVSPDDVAFLRSVAAAVLDGPRRPELLRPFPDGWTLRAAYRLKEGLAVVDVAPPPLPTDAPAPPAGALRWETGSHEELMAAQALLVTVAKNIPEVTRVVLLVAGEPAETLAGHIDLTHPLRADAALASDEAPLPAPTPTPTPAAAATPAAAPTVAAPTAPSPVPTPRPKAPPKSPAPTRPLAQTA